MKFSLSWLKEFVDISESPSQIAKILTQAGIEVDSVEQSPLAFENVIIGKVLAVSKHPTADRLQVATVFDGVREHQVVCGAPNCRAGIKTAFAPVGATLKEESGKVFTIKKTKIRDVESCGMLCSAKELQIGLDADGIIEFADHLAEGSIVADMYADSIFEVSLTPNLGHCLSVAGIARELSAAIVARLKFPAIYLKESHTPIEDAARVVVEDVEGCPRYAFRVIRNMKVGPSPDWLRKKLEDCGLRSVNNIVDATNYVLMELGHPLHAFDLDKLEGQQIIVRKAKPGEVLTTLDGKERKLTLDDILICDKSRPVALAGVMGGQNSEVDDNTCSLLIESAYFKPEAIRRTSKRLGIQTDASKRFERSADPNQVIESLDRVTMLIHELAGGDICKGVMDVSAKKFPKAEVLCRLSRINGLLGTHLGVGEVEEIFRRLGFESHWDGRDTFKVLVPTFRADVNIEVDLIEEVARLYGFDNIPVEAPRYHASTLPMAPVFAFERIVRTHMLAEGLQEFLTCDLIGPSLLDIVQDTSIPSESTVKVLNPTSIEQSILRTSLLPGLLEVVKYNVDHQNTDIHGFEIGRVHFKQNSQYVEQSVLGVVLSGSTAPESWSEPLREVDFYDLKGVIENLFRGLGIKNVEFKPNELTVFHSGRQASIFVGALEVGSIGEVDPAIQRRLDVAQRIYFAEINLPDLYPLCAGQTRMEALPLYPSSGRDWTVTLKEETAVEEVFKILRQTNSRLLESINLVPNAIYRSDKLGSGIKNVTFHFVYRDRKKTIAQETVDAEHARIIERASKNLETL